MLLFTIRKTILLLSKKDVVHIYIIIIMFFVQNICKVEKHEYFTYIYIT